uniref:ATP-dependent DNA helicase n=1 Tax=Sander lucioperca TaxID=283035 RepID=A0A8C9XC72_SANLU
MGFVQRRKDDKPAIIRFYRASKEKYPEKFYGTLLKLYVPYRSEQELKRPYYPTYESFYSNGCVQLPGCDHLESVQHIVKRNRDKYEKNSDEIENAVEEFEQNRGVIDEWCNLAPESEVVRLECIEELEAREPDCENEQDNVPEYSNQANAATEIRAIREPPAFDPILLRQMYQNLNQRQACVFYAVREWCCKANLWPKSAAASKILCKLPRRAEEADISNPTVLLTAFTGTAAFNISGSTLHSLLKLPRSLKPPFQGLGNNLDEVRSELLNAEILIIDEVSMVSKPLFAYVDVRLKQIKGSQRPFGGMSVIAVGDFFQLPPVRQSKALCVYDPCEIDLWQEHFQMITLTEIMRQKDDVAFAEMLNRIRVKEKSEELSEADRALLSQAVTEPELCPTDVLHIFATNKQVDSHNSAMLALLHSHITKIDADDYKKDPQTGRMARQAKPFKGNRNELPDTLNVAEGVRVMLTRNIDVSQGLVNGSFATNYLVRRQFPVKLAFACTIHKVQGMTRTSAVVSLKHIFEPGMAYVAVSRVTSLSGLHILDMDESKIYANPQITGALRTMRQLNCPSTMDRHHCWTTQGHLNLHASPSHSSKQRMR